MITMTYLVALKPNWLATYMASQAFEPWLKGVTQHLPHYHTITLESPLVSVYAPPAREARARGIPSNPCNALDQYIQREGVPAIGITNAGIATLLYTPDGAQEEGFTAVLPAYVELDALPSLENQDHYRQLWRTRQLLRGEPIHG